MYLKNPPVKPLGLFNYDKALKINLIFDKYWHLFFSFVGYDDTTFWITLYPCYIFIGIKLLAIASCLFDTCSTWSNASFFFFFFFGHPAAYRVPWPGFRSEPQLQPMPSYGNMGSFNPLCSAGDWTCILVLQRGHWSYCTNLETPMVAF